MNRLTVTIGGLDYTISCKPGEEDRLRELAAGFDEIVQGMKVKVGEIGDRRIAVMAGLSVLDRLRAAEAQNAKLNTRVAALERAREAAALAAESDDDVLVQRLEETAAAIDAVTSLINRDTRNRTRPGERKVVPTVEVSRRRKPEPDAAPEEEAEPLPEPALDPSARLLDQPAPDAPAAQAAPAPRFGPGRSRANPRAQPAPGQGAVPPTRPAPPPAAEKLEPDARRAVPGNDGPADGAGGIVPAKDRRPA